MKYYLDVSIKYFNNAIIFLKIFMFLNIIYVILLSNLIVSKDIV